jgi:hypothetical protein
MRSIPICAQSHWWDDDLGKGVVNEDYSTGGDQRAGPFDCAFDCLLSSRFSHWISHRPLTQKNYMPAAQYAHAPNEQSDDD